MQSVQPPRVLHDGAPPRDRHGQEQGVQSRFVETLSDVPPRGEDQELLAIGDGGQSGQRLSALLLADTSLQHNQVPGECPQAPGEKVEMILSLGEHQRRTSGVERADDVVQYEVVSAFVTRQRAIDALDGKVGLARQLEFRFSDDQPACERSDG